MLSKHILVTEDDAAIRKLLAMSLTRQGYSISQASSVAEALDQVQQQKPDLMLLDLNIRGGTGFDVLIKVREQYKPHELPIIVVSALSQEHNQERGMQLGAQGYIIKPFRLPELMLALEPFLC